TCWKNCRKKAWRHRRGKTLVTLFLLDKTTTGDGIVDGATSSGGNWCVNVLEKLQEKGMAPSARENSGHVILVG
ncbi:hypothetical protein V5H42_25695, partial [Salmonella enterica]